MSIQNFPQVFLPSAVSIPDIFVYDYKMSSDVINSKVNMTLNTFSFLQTGRKHVNFGNSTIAVNESQSILIKNSNCLVTELLSHDQIYFCKLFFFSQKILLEFVEKHQIPISNKNAKSSDPFFVIENDSYIHLFLESINNLMLIENNFNLMKLKFEEFMLYLISKYGQDFIDFSLNLIDVQSQFNFKKIVETNEYANLNLEELAFLLNMSLSSFKRNFKEEFGVSPGKWFQKKRLQKAKQLIEIQHKKPSEIYFEFGYNNLSNFSAAFKNEFGFYPKSLIN